MTEIQLDLKDRLILANQCKILEKLCPDEAKHYANARRILEEGLEAEYDECFGSLAHEAVPSAVTREVYDILQMYSDIDHAYKALEDKSGIPYPESTTKFHGFDGNKDFQHLAALDQIVHHDGKFNWLNIQQGLNSHSSATLGMYREMLPVWRKIRESNNPWTKAQLLELIEAEKHPSRRTPVKTS